MIKALKIKSEFDFCKLLDVLNSIILVNVTFNYLAQDGLFSFNSIAVILPIFLLVFLKFNSLKNIRYTFWFTLFLNTLIIIFYSFFFFKKNLVLFQLLTSYVFIFFECYIMSSPIFFPRVNWWEFDFRFRNDLKVKVLIDEEEFNGRMIDLRRGSLGLTLFKAVSQDTEVKIILNEKLYITGKVVTSREPNPGRGLFYGIRVNDGQRYSDIKKIWDARKKYRMRKRFVSGS
jgi:hypothetical protein